MQDIDEVYGNLVQDKTIKISASLELKGRELLIHNDGDVTLLFINNIDGIHEEVKPNERIVIELHNIYFTLQKLRMHC